jgi:cation:H+ antiporter
MEPELAGVLALGVSITFFGGLLFVNAIDYVGYRARWTGSFTGVVVSPLFTSIPELLMFLVALYIYGGVSGEKIGIGTVLGQPFMAATIIFPAIFLVALIGYIAGRRVDMVLDVERNLVIPYILFTAVYPIMLLPMVPSLGSNKYVTGKVLLVLYFIYTYIMYRSRSLAMLEAEEAYLARIQRADSGLLKLSLASIRLLTAVLLIMIGSKMLVAGVDEVSKALEASPIALAILITPLAGVLPESITAII